MALPFPQEWLHPPSLSAATALQRELATRVVAEDAFGPVRRVAGADVSANRFDPTRTVYAAVASLDWPGLEVAETGLATGRSAFPYVPGYLSFRESPILLDALDRLVQPPDLIFVDGHGISHPRGIGVASHVGVLLDRPTIGVAKSILVGQPAGPLGPEPGDSVPLVWHERQIATVLRTRRNARPVYVSVGHRVSLATAVDWVLRAGRGYRLPEPTRQAHLAANRLRRSL